MLANDVSVLELESLVGPIEPIPCEHSQHNQKTDNHDDGNAVMYQHAICPKCHHDLGITAVCQRWVNVVLGNPSLRCRDCKEYSQAKEAVRLFSFVNGFQER